MIWDMLMSMTYVFMMIVIMNTFGKRLIQHNSFAENLIAGYVVYIVLCSLLGMCAQFLSIPWKYYQWAMILLLLGVIGFSFYGFSWHVDKAKIKQHFVEYGLYYLMAAVFVGLGLIYIYYQWLNNHIDDAWYLGKVKMVPDVDNMSTLYYPTGFHYPADYVRMVNTFEIELAFFAHVLRVSPSFFVKVAQSYLMYFMILNLFHLLYQKLLSDHWKNNNYLFSVIMLSALLFGWYHELLAGKEILYMHDSWQFNTAIWYGSSTVRTMSLILLLHPFLDVSALSVKKIIGFVLTCIFLMTRASQAIPTIYLAVATYICYRLLVSAQQKRQLYWLIAVILLVMAGIPAGEEVSVQQDVIYMVMKNNITSILLMIVILLVILSFQLNNKRIRKWNCWLMIMAGLMFLPRINTLFLKFCIYDFVVARTTTLYLFTLAATGFCYLGYFLHRILQSNKKMMILYGGIAVYLIAVPILYIQQIYGVKHALAVLYHNPKLLPESTLSFSEELEAYAKQSDEPLYVLAPAVVGLDGTVHSLAAMLRYEAYDIYVVGAIPRYSGMDEDNLFYGYTQKEQDVFEHFNDGTQPQPENMKALFNQYPINCLVVTNEQAKQAAVKELGFQEAFDFHWEQGSTYYVLKK